jgi:hypothetical protein
MKRGSNAALMRFQCGSSAVSMRFALSSGGRPALPGGQEDSPPPEYPQHVGIQARKNAHLPEKMRV